MLQGRLGLEKSRIPHSDRHGVMWLDRGKLEVEDGCLRFVTRGGELQAGDYQIPYQGISIILLGLGTSVTHDALRLLARHGCAMAAVGHNGVRCYTAPPIMADTSALARSQVSLWSDPVKRMGVACAMYTMRFGEVLRTRNINVLRGQEGARIKRAYQTTADRYGIKWKGRNYDRHNPEADDIANEAINHASVVVKASAAIAIAATATIPQLGFIHEDSGESFALDIADLYRHSLLLDIAFGATKEAIKTGNAVERLVRNHAAVAMRKHNLVADMIDRIKTLLQSDLPAEG